MLLFKLGGLDETIYRRHLRIYLGSRGCPLVAKEDIEMESEEKFQYFYEVIKING